jgi:hypothetical protein
LYRARSHRLNWERKKRSDLSTAPLLSINKTSSESLCRTFNLSPEFTAATVAGNSCLLRAVRNPAAEIDILAP